MLWELQLALSAPFVVAVSAAAAAAAFVVGQMIYMRQSQVLHAAGRCSRRLQKQHVGLQSSIELTPFPFHATPYQAIRLHSIAHYLQPPLGAVRFGSVHFAGVQFICICIGHVLERVIFLLISQTNMYKYEFEWSLHQQPGHHVQKGCSRGN